MKARFGVMALILLLAVALSACDMPSDLTPPAGGVGAGEDENVEGTEAPEVTEEPTEVATEEPTEVATDEPTEEATGEATEEAGTGRAGCDGNPGSYPSALEKVADEYEVTVEEVQDWWCE